jgi:hypothetical protein
LDKAEISTEHKTRVSYICIFVLRPPLWSQFLATDPEVRDLFQALPDFLSSSGSGTGTFSLMSTIEEVLERESSGSGLDNREYGRRDPSR